MAKILIVDDDPDLVEACSLILQRAGHVVKAAYNVDEGRAAMASFDPDLLILDVMMDQPDDGIAFAQELRRTSVTKPILMLTSVSKVTGFRIEKDADLVPVDAFEEKPVKAERLVSLVDSLLKK